MIFEHKMTIDHYLLLILTILPFIYKYNFWFYVIQLKEYRWDRFREYLNTLQGKNAIINIWSVIEFPLLLISFYVFYDELFEIILYPVVFYFLLMQNLFVFRKILKSNFLKPKITSRLLLTQILLIISIIISIGVLDLFEISNYLYTYILTVFLFLPFIIFFIILLTLPFVHYKKRKIINTAIKKTKMYNQPIKIGITGSYGKSSVKEFLSSILEQEGNTLKTPENINSELGVSDLIIKELNNDYKYFVAEMGAYRVGEIDLLGKIVNHKYGFLTAIGNQHLGLFGSIKNIIKGKSEIKNSVIKNNGILYVNWNNPDIRNINFPNNLNIVKYGNFEGSDTKFEILGIKEGNTKIIYEYKGAKTIFFIPLIGEHNIINISGVIAFCYDIGLKTSDLNKYIKNIESPKNTLTIKNYEDFILIDDTYNLSEAGLFAGIEVLNSFKLEKILVVDDILELGKKANKIHFEIGKTIAIEKNIDKILYVGSNYKLHFLKGLIDGGFDKENIITKLPEKISNNVILFEGRNSGKYLNNIIKNV